MKNLVLIIAIVLLPTMAFAQYTYIPDSNFEQALIDLGLDEGELNLTVPTANIEGVKSLQIYEKEISDLTGIEDFVALEELYCHKNSLTTLDVSKNVNLNTLYCYQNQLKKLDVSNLIKLQYLLCDNNELESINFGYEHPDLISLRCNNNKLYNLQVYSLRALRWLICNDNKIHDLQLMSQEKLVLLSCSNNNLNLLDIQNGSNANMRQFGSFPGMDARNNPSLHCILVDDTNAAKGYTDWAIDDHSIYARDCGYYSVGEYLVNNEITIFPNPASSTFVVRFELESPQAVTMSLSDLSGNVLQEFTLANALNVNEEIDVSQLPSGVYFLNVSIGDETVSKKVVVE